MKNTIAITMSDKLTYEVEQLIEEAKSFYENVLVVDARSVYYKFIRGNELPDIIFDGKNLNKLPQIIIRMTRGREQSTALLANTLHICSTDIVDPIERFQTITTSKLITTVQRFKNNSGSSTFIAFNKQNALTMLDEIDCFPLIGKPIAGKRKEGVTELQNKSETKKYITSFFNKRASEEDPVFLQELIDLKSELRVFLLDGKMVTWMKKQRFRKKKIGMKNVRKIIGFVEKNCSDKGILGVDVGLDKNGEVHIIEANRAPQWKFLQKRKKVNMAKEILKSIRKE